MSMNSIRGEVEDILRADFAQPMKLDALESRGAMECERPKRNVNSQDEYLS